MSVRDENMIWKSEATKMSEDVESALLPIFNKALKNGMSIEDFFYIVNDAAQTIILQYIRHIRHEQRKKQG